MNDNMLMSLSFIYIEIEMFCWQIWTQHLPRIWYMLGWRWMQWMLLPVWTPLRLLVVMLASFSMMFLVFVWMLGFLYVGLFLGVGTVLPITLLLWPPHLKETICGKDIAHICCLMAVSSAYVYFKKKKKKFKKISCYYLTFTRRKMSCV